MMNFFLPSTNFNIYKQLPAHASFALSIPLKSSLIWSNSQPLCHLTGKYFDIIL